MPILSTVLVVCFAVGLFVVVLINSLKQDIFCVLMGFLLVGNFWSHRASEIDTCFLAFLVEERMQP